MLSVAYRTKFCMQLVQRVDLQLSKGGNSVRNRGFLKKKKMQVLKLSRTIFTKLTSGYTCTHIPLRIDRLPTTFLAPLPYTPLLSIAQSSLLLQPTLLLLPFLFRPGLGAAKPAKMSHPPPILTPAANLTLLRNRLRRQCCPLHWPPKHTRSVSPFLPSPSRVRTCSSSSFPNAIIVIQHVFNASGRKPASRKMKEEEEERARKRERRLKHRLV